MTRRLLPLIFSLLSPALAVAALLPTKVILQKTVDNSGSGLFAIEQEVQFFHGDTTLTVKENWLIESDRTMRLTVTGGKDLQGAFKLQYLYTGGQKWSLANGSRRSEKAPDDFLEKYLNFRNVDILANHLTRLKIIPEQALAKKPFVKVGNEFKYEAEGWLRFSRTGGSVTYALGTPSPTDQEVANPGLWIEQDQFVVRKVRLPSQVEMSASNYSSFSKGLFYPKTRVIRWGNNTVTVRLISASPRPPTAVSLLQPSSLDTQLNWSGLENLAAKDVITEFYTRFR